MAFTKLIGVVEDGSRPSPLVPVDPRREVSMIRGETATFGIYVVRRDNSPVDLTLATLTMRVKILSRSSLALLTLEGKAADSMPTNYRVFTVGAPQTRQMQPRRYVYDVRLERPVGQSSVADVVVPLSIFALAPGLVYP